MRALERALDASILAFGAWTLMVQALVFGAHGSFNHVLWASAPSAAIGLLPFLVGARRPANGTGHRDHPARPSRLDRILMLLIGSTLVLILAVGVPYVVFWFGAVLFLAVLAFRSRHAELDLRPGLGERRSVLVAFAGLMLLAALLTAISHRPDSDDGFLLSVASRALTHPDEPLYSQDSLHQPPGLPIVFPTYRCHTVEILYAVASKLLGVAPIWVAHAVIPPFAALLAVASSGLLLRRLLPRTWILGLLVLVVFWVTMGEPHEGFANHALVRLFQGKAVLVSALVPYLVHASIRCMETGRGIYWLVLQAGVIGAAGLSATGLFVAPLVVGISALACWTPGAAPTRRLGATLGTAGYSLVIALLLRSAVASKLDLLNSSALYGYVKTYAAAMDQALGTDAFLHLQMLGLLAAPALAFDSGRRRWLATALLTFFTTAVNPLLFRYWVDYVTSAPVAWRLWWAVPVPVFLSISFFSAVEDGGSWHRVGFRRIALLASAVAVLGFVPARWALSARNGVTLGVPGLKVPRSEYEVAAAICRLAPSGSAVLAPREITMWVTTSPGHPRLVAHKMNTLKVMASYMPPGEAELRARLFAYVAGAARRQESMLELARSIDHFDIGLVARPAATRWGAEIDALLTDRDFVRSEMGGYVLWARRDSPTDE